MAIGIKHQEVERRYGSEYEIGDRKGHAVIYTVTEGEPYGVLVPDSLARRSFIEVAKGVYRFVTQRGAAAPGETSYERIMQLTLMQFQQGETSRW